METTDDLWAPVVDELRSLGSGEDLANQSLWWLLLMGFVAGLLAVCMPCIWPIIPMTVSFFLKRSKNDKQRGIRDAFTYGLSIIVIYLGLGLLVTALFGSDTLNAMSTNAVFNVFLFLLLVIFALSFFGWFEIKLPDSWANKVDTKASETSSRWCSCRSHAQVRLWVCCWYRPQPLATGSHLQWVCSVLLWRWPYPLRCLPRSPHG